MLSLVNKPTTLRNPDPFAPDVIADIRKHAEDEFPKESCGIVTSDGYIPCDNIHENPTEAFRIDPDITADYLQRGAILAVVHSHPNGPNYPSLADQQHQIQSGLTWGIVPVLDMGGDADDPVGAATDVLWWGDDLPKQPLERRRFIWGIFHCWSLYRDWFLQTRGILLPNFACPADFAETGVNIFLDNVAAAGLKDVGKLDISQLEEGDMVVGHLRGEFPNHCGVYLGGDDFLHHLPNTASRKDSILRWWPHIDTVFRYDSEKATSLRKPS